MTRLRIQVALLMLVLSAAVAVFSGVVPVPLLNAGKHNLPAVHSNGAVILMADGTDPQPKPTPLPWLGVAS
jgi:prepilin-type processing-associated H-X9-DG protein